jgi:hypothetical protein
MGSKVFHSATSTADTYAEAKLLANPMPYDAHERKERLIEIRKSNLPF